MIPASTLVLLRDHPTNGMEVFMLQRHQKIRFAGGALVFPGGKIDASDASAELRLHCDGADELDDQMLAARVAAIRETFEESGYLLARREGTTGLVCDNTTPSLQKAREQLHGNELSLLAFLQRESLRIACDSVLHFAHWITPEAAPRQYDTHFFISRVPDNQIGAHDGTESIDSSWDTPARYLNRAQDGDAVIIFPTRMNLYRLMSAPDAKTTLALSREQPIVTVRPWVEDRPDGPALCIPAGAGYDRTEGDLLRVMREEGVTMA